MKLAIPSEAVIFSRISACTRTDAEILDVAPLDAIGVVIVVFQPGDDAGANLAQKKSRRSTAALRYGRQIRDPPPVPADPYTTFLPP